MTTTDQIEGGPTAAPEVETIAGYEIHPAARRLPEPTLEEYERLKADIKEHGLRIPIVLTPDAEILDGRTRVRACAELGVPCASRTTTVDEAVDPVGFVLSMNAARRHLSATKVVEIYLEANKAKLEADQKSAKAAQRANLKQGGARGVSTTPTGKMAARIAEATGVSESTVKNVLSGKKAAAPEGTPPETARESKKTTKEEVRAATKKVTGKGYQGCYLKYGIGRRSIEAIISRWQQTMNSDAAIGLQVLADAKRMGHPDFDQWLTEATGWHIQVAAVLDLLKKKTAPTIKDLKAILDPDDGNPTEPEP
jgi:ParB-like chromosome segregation protein Spo0J